MPATRAAAAAKNTLSSATCETTETIRACMHYLRRRTTGRDRLFHSHLSENPGRVACYASTSESPLASEKLRNNLSRSKKVVHEPRMAVFTEPGIIETWLSDVGQTGRNVIGRRSETTFCRPFIRFGGFGDLEFLNLGNECYVFAVVCDLESSPGKRMI